jgi:glycosyltransferase involved in cell wall biosynthesis
MHDGKQTAVIIPALDPDGTLEGMVAELRSKGLAVIVVDDGSTETDPALWTKVTEGACRGTRVIHHARNLGKGAALRTGMRCVMREMPAATCVVTMDADGQHLVADLDRLLTASLAHPDALVLGTRSFDGDVPTASGLGARISRAALRLASGACVSDTQTGFRAFGRKLLPQLVQVGGERYEYETNVLMFCARSGIDLLEEPISTVYHDRRNSCSHFRKVGDSIRIAKALVSYSLSSLACFGVDYGLYALLLATLPHTARSIAFAAADARIVSATVNYSVNRSLVFRSRRPNSRALPEYALLAVVVLLADCALTLALVRLTALGPLSARIVSEALLFLASFTVQRTMIFPPRRPEGAVA